MNTNPINVTQSSLPSFDEYINAIKDLWQSRWLTNMGAKHKELEVRLKAYLGVSDVALFVNGHLALEVAIQAMGLSGEAITTPFTFASTTHAIIRSGLEPVFCDVNETDYTIDAEKIEGLITDKTSAIIPVHVYGSICDVEAIERIAKKHGLKVIYDAAHAFGVEYKGRGIGSFGDASMFSFHATKVFNTIEGGAVCYGDGEYGLKLGRMKNFGIKSEVEVDEVGTNAKMNEFQAAMGICNLRYADECIEKRAVIVRKYRELLGGATGVKLLQEQEGVKPNYSYFPVVFEESFGATRDDVYEKLKENGVFSRKYFYPLTSSFECFRGRYDVKATPTALDVAKRVLTLPLYPGLTEDEVSGICKVILSIKKDWGHI